MKFQQQEFFFFFFFFFSIFKTFFKSQYYNENWHFVIIAGDIWLQFY